MYCNHCGAHNPDDARFCSKCGAAVAVESGRPASSPPHPAAHPSPPRARPHPPASAEPMPETGRVQAPAAAHRDAPFNPKGFVFPTISVSEILDLPTARAHTMAGLFAAIFGMIMSVVTIKVFGGAMAAVAAFYAVIGIGLWYSSRIAAVAGFLLAVGNVIAMVILTKGNVTTWMMILTVLLAVAYWNAVRGTFAEHRLAGRMPGAAAARRVV